MKLKKFILIFVSATCMALTYTQMQFNIYALAYNGKERETEVFRLVDENSYVAYNIAKLKSANNLGLELLTDQGDIGFFGDEQIVRVTTPLPSLEETTIASAPVPNRMVRLFAGIFSLKSTAEARQLR